MDRQDWLLLALDFAGGQTLSPAQLQKSLFLLGQELPETLGTPDFYQFIPYNYGPWCRQIYDDAESLASVGLVAVLREPGASYVQYAITVRGRERGANLRALANARGVSYLERIVAWVLRQSFSQLVRAIYQKYPEFRQNSVFQE